MLHQRTHLGQEDSPLVPVASTEVAGLPLGRPSFYQGHDGLWSHRSLDLNPAANQLCDLGQLFPLLGFFISLPIKQE